MKTDIPVEIKLDENYHLEADDVCWTLTFEKEGEMNEKTGKPKFTRNQSYYGQLNHALTAYVDKKAKGSDSAKELLKRFNEVEKTILSVEDKILDYLKSNPDQNDRKCIKCGKDTGKKYCCDRMTVIKKKEGDPQEPTPAGGSTKRVVREEAPKKKAAKKARH